VLPVVALSVVLVVLIKLAWITPKTVTSRLRYVSPDQAGRVQAAFDDVNDETAKIAAEVAKLRDENTKLQNVMGDKNKESKLLNDSLQEVKLFAGLTEVEGPGLSITLRDARRSRANALDADSMTIHDIDVLKVVNELWNAGAEAVSVNNQRITAGSNIRCVGAVIYVDNVHVAPPIVIRAIGEPQTLKGGMDLPMSILDELRSVDPGMVQMETLKNMRLPAYSGSTARKQAKVPKDAK
jgi:uncharacterized protein YlxW (UPF0749 family)